MVPKDVTGAREVSSPAPPPGEPSGPPAASQSSAASVPEPRLPEVAAEPVTPPSELPANWREELSGRVENFRRRRASLRNGFDPGSSLELEFGPPSDQQEEIGEAEVETSPQPQEVDVELSEPEEEVPLLESLPLEKPGEGIRMLSSAAVEAGEAPLEPPEVESEPVEIVMEPSRPRPMGRAPGIAPLGARFLAGLADLLVLALGGGLFGAIFWTAGGHLTLGPLNLAVLGFLAVLTLLAYFGLFTALEAATPGLLGLHLRVRNLEGNPPTAAESFWRAFGYLVSLASLFLGFTWALVDSDQMTWHDRISGTYISPAK